LGDITPRLPPAGTDVELKWQLRSRNTQGFCSPRKTRERGRTGSKEYDNENRPRVISRDMPSRLFTKSIDAQHAFEWHETVNSRGDEIRLDLTIIDAKLKRLIASQLDDFPEHWDQEQMAFQGDFWQIVHNWDRFEPSLRVVLFQMKQRETIFDYCSR
jgi:hypothetical protein